MRSVWSPRRRRDRHGRGLRGPLAPAGLPVSRTRAEQFDDLVAAALERLDRRWSAELADVEVVVEDVPPTGQEVPLGRTDPAVSGRPARLVVYRRPVEARAAGLPAREELVLHVVVAQLAELLGLDPEAVDPDA